MISLPIKILLIKNPQPIFNSENEENNNNNYYDGCGRESVFLQKPIGELIGLTCESTYLTICHPDDSLEYLLDLFTRRQIHRVLVVERKRRRPGDDNDNGLGSHGGVDDDYDDGNIGGRIEGGGGGSGDDDGGRQGRQERPTALDDDDSKPCFVSQTDVVRFLFQYNHILGKSLDTLALDVANKASILFESSSSSTSSTSYTTTPPPPLSQTASSNSITNMNNATDQNNRAIKTNNRVTFKNHNDSISNHHTTERKISNHELSLSSITIHDQALTAFKKIHQDGVSAVAVVNDDGSLVGEVSAADLRGLNRDRLGDLRKPVIAFLTSCKGDLIKPLTCHGKFTLSQVMSGIIHSKTHRAWVVDEDDIPIGVITLSDILTMFRPDVLSLS